MMRPSRLRERSGNEPAGRMEAKPPEWEETRAALRRLQEGLSCSRCSDILKKPVNFGGCEHVFCLTCVGDCIGTACPVCSMPAMVQDVKVNRQLDNIIKLYSKMQNLQGGNLLGSGDNQSAPGKETSEEQTKKKEIKMWFSPRSGKMRFVLKKMPEKQVQRMMDNFSEPQAPTSPYDFLPSPPQELIRDIKKSQPKCKKKPKKKTLRDINQQWGLTWERQKDITECDKTGSDENKEKVVSFCSQPLIIPSSDPSSISGHGSVIDPNLVQSESDLTMGISTFLNPTEKCSDDNLSSSHDVSGVNLTSENCLLSNGETSLLKRRRQQTVSPTSLSKRSKRKRQGRSGNSFNSDFCSRQPLEDSFGKTSSSSFLSTSTTSTLSVLRNLEDFQSASSHILDSEILTLSNNATQSEAQKIVLFSKKSPNSRSTKRNHKGETLLHTASIEGDLSTLEYLLKDGADPNVKDYAGWTPLHEACSHGHKEVVELLLQHGALLNAAGYQNDLPLHDAVKNGHTSIVELLLLHGASRDAVNIFGKRPMDYAETEKMKSLLLLPVKESSSVTQSTERDSRASNHSILQSRNQSPADIEALPYSIRHNRGARNLEHSNRKCVREEGPVVLLGSGLDPNQQQLLSKLAAVLKARICTEFNSTVTHLVIPEQLMRSTLKCMLAVLNGCWILTFKWVEVCLEMRAKEQEEKYEIDGGPKRGRLNKEQLLPKLFDGCYFYFLGMFKEHNKEDLKELVKAGGGQLLMRKPKSDNDVTQAINTVAYHAKMNSDQSFCTQYIIYDGSSSYNPDKIRQGKVWEVPANWLIDCVLSFQLLPVTT